MTLQPRSTDDIYESIRTSLVSNISKISNFVTGSFNDAFLTSYSEQIREAEIKALASEFAGTVDYAGKELTQADLDREGKENVTPEEINPYMKDQHLDNLGANFGVTRYPGSKATGTVTLDVATNDTKVPDGFEVATQPTSSGEIDRYIVTLPENDDDSSQNTVTPDANQSVTVDIVAEEVGDEYNTGPGTISYIPNPKPGIQGVSNVDALNNGEPEQSNRSLREDIRSALFDSSGGGTTSGIEGYIENNASERVTVGGIDEYVDSTPPYADVVVDGGDDPEIRQLIEESRPVGIRHNLVRPSVIKMGSLAYVVGTDIQPTSIRDSVSQFLESLGAGETFYWSSMLQQVMGVDNNIRSIPALNMTVNEVEQDRKEYDDTQSVYSLTYGPIGSVYNEEHLVDDQNGSYELMFDQVDSGSVSVTVIVGDDKRDLADSEFTTSDTSGDGGIDTVVLDDAVTPDQGTTVSIDYTHAAGTFDSIVGVDGSTFDQGVDYETTDSNGDGQVDAITWLDGGTSPNLGDRFELQYSPKRSISGDVEADSKERFGADSGLINVRTVTE